MSTLIKVDYHHRGTGPPTFQDQDRALIELLDSLGERTYHLATGGTVQINIETDLTAQELAGEIISAGFTCTGEIDDMKIKSDQGESCNVHTNERVAAE